MIKNLNDINMHLKLESLIKDDVKTTWTTDPRPILWQRKGVTALFSSIFMEAKKRFKELLSNKVVYVDGLTPQ